MPSDFSHLRELANELQNWAVEEARNTAHKGEEAAHRRVPVRTGALSISIGVDDTPDGAELHAQSTEGGANREYAGYVEYGTRHTPSQPFMTPAVPEMEAELERGTSRIKHKAEGMQE